MSTISRSISIVVLLSLILTSSILFSMEKKKGYQVPRPVIGGLHIGMSQDSVDIVLKKLALRKNTFRLDSFQYVESDSVRIFSEPAYLRIALLHGRVRTLVINYHPLSGDHYLNTRDMVQQYLEQYFGRGVITRDQSVVYRRWENEDGTMEVSFTDKYMRVFMRLGKW